MNQSKKIAAFLNKLPYYAIFPETALKMRQEVINSLIGSDIDLPQIDHITKIASSLDIPPFVSELDQDCFIKNPCLTHLLSAQTHSLEMGELNADAVHNHLLKTIDSIKQLPEAQEDLFLALWRYLPEKLAENDSSNIGKYWHVLPADPCIPSHSIWEHSSIASAIAGAYPDPHLLIFTIASAQEMVTTARRTQDAWMGSFLLSYLSWQAVKVIAEECGPDALIFPSLRSQPIVDLWLKQEKGFSQLTIDKSGLEVGNIPNIFTAIVPGDSDYAKSLAEKAQLSVKNKWMEISECVRTQCESTVKNSENWDVDISSWKDIWERQQNGFLDDMGMFWSVCPWGNDANKVISTAQKHGKIAQLKKNDPIVQLNELMMNIQNKNYPTNIGMVFHPLSGFAAKGLTARKNLRDFHNNPEPGHRCTLCGKWQAVHPKFSDLTEVKCVTDLIKNNQLIEQANNEKYSYRWLLSFWRAFGNISRKDHLKLKGRVRKGERLCSLCLTRRLAMEAYFERIIPELDRHQFPSTAGICTASYRGNILKAIEKEPEKWHSTLNDYVTTVTTFIKTNDLPYPASSVEFYKKLSASNNLSKKFLKIDGDWLFDITYDFQTLKNMYDLDSPETIEECKEALQSLNKLAKDNGIAKPSPYYAIIAMDGDKMGEWLTGRKAPEYQWLFHPDVRNNSLFDMVPVEFKRPLGPALQLGMSDSLKNYALHLVRKIVEKDHPGKLIYAGGDDVLAFVPVEDLFEIMEALYLNFQGKENGYLEDDSSIMRLMGGKLSASYELETSHQGMSASMGVLILHHSYPLYHALHQAQEVLKKTAKERIGRDAFAIRLMRRSGEFTETGFKFSSSENAPPCDMLHKMAQIFQLFIEGTLSSRIAYRMSEHLWAHGNNDTVSEDIQQARQAELKRLIRQHLGDLKDKVLELYGPIDDYEKLKQLIRKYTNEQIENVLSLFNHINDYINGCMGDTSREQISMDPWETTADLLMILRFMAGKGDNYVA